MNAYINGIEIPFDPAEVPGFTYSLWSLTEPDKVSGSRTTTFTIPATAEVRQILGSPSVTESVDKFHTLTIANGSAVIWEARVVVASRTRDAYEVFAVGDNGGWTRAAKDTRLQDLDLGESPAVTSANIQASWADTDQTVHWPVIDYGDLEGRAISYDVDPGQLRPAVRVWRIIAEFFMRNGLSVKASGKFERLWKKLIIPHTTGYIGVSDSYLTGNTTEASLPSAQSLTISGQGGFFEAVQTTTVVDDPGGNLSGFTYVAPYDQTMTVSMSFDMTATFNAYITNRHMFLQAYNVTTSAVVGQVLITIPFTTSWTKSFEATTYAFNVSAGDVIQARLYYADHPLTPWRCTAATVNTATATFTPTNIEYQENITFDVASTLPDLTVADVVSAVAASQCLVVGTDYTTNTVTFQHLDDFLKDTSQGAVWSDRVNTAEASVRVQDAIPARVEFRWAEDDRDANAEDFFSAYGRNYGDADIDIEGGYAAPYRVSLKFAATHDRPYTGSSLGGLQMPVMWERDRTYQTATYKRKPRILIADGTYPAPWTLAGASVTEFPRVYFVSNTDIYGYTLSFSTEASNGTSAFGTTLTHWRNRLAWMASGDVVEAYVMVYDDEAGTFDFGRPVCVDYGYGEVWCYVEKVDEKRFGEQAYSRLRLIPLTNG